MDCRTTPIESRVLIEMEPNSFRRLQEYVNTLALGPEVHKQGEILHHEPISTAALPSRLALGPMDFHNFSVWRASDLGFFEGRKTCFDGKSCGTAGTRQVSPGGPLVMGLIGALSRGFPKPKTDIGTVGAQLGASYWGIEVVGVSYWRGDSFQLYPGAPNPPKVGPTCNGMRKKMYTYRYIYIYMYTHVFSP